MLVAKRFLLAMVSSVIMLLALVTTPAALNTETRTLISAEAALSSSPSLLLPNLQLPSYSLFPFNRNLQTSDDANASATDATAGSSSGDRNLKALSGTWRTIPGVGVQAGAPPLYAPYNILLQFDPVNPARSEISTSFTVNSLVPDVASYVSIVYSFKDLDNFKYAGITFYDNQTYADFATVSDGVLSWDPEWPGSNMELGWVPGDPIRMTLSLRGDSQLLNINGIESLEHDTEDVGGLVGLSYARVQDVLFNQFSVREGPR